MGHKATLCGYEVRVTVFLGRTMTSAEVCAVVRTAIARAQNSNLTFDGYYDPTDQGRVLFCQRSPGGLVTVQPVESPGRLTRFFSDGELYSSVLVTVCELRGAESQAEEDPIVLSRAAQDFVKRLVSVLG